MYWPVLRNSLPEIFDIFDFANPSMVTGSRDVSSTPPQALFLMNNATISDYANRIAMRKDLPAELPARVKRLYEILFVRQPVEDEMVLTKKYLGENPDVAKWQKFVHALLLTNEFSYID